MLKSSPESEFVGCGQKCIDARNATKKRTQTRFKCDYS